MSNVVDDLGTVLFLHVSVIYEFIKVVAWVDLNMIVQ